jgi:spermidine synthase
MVKRYAALIEQLQPRNIFELGISAGGSCVFLQKAARPKKLVTIDISADRIAALDEYIELNRLADTLKPFYGVDQADSKLLADMVVREFDGEPLDLVIDDASHYLEETRHSFNTLFPHVRPNGVYVIEDWSWAHAHMGNADDTAGFWPEREPLTKLIFEIVLACPSTLGMIDRIEIDRNSATIWRGTSAIDPAGFDIAKMCLARGRALVP